MIHQKLTEYNLAGVNIVMMTHSALNSDAFSEFIMDNPKMFDTVFIDEAHNVCDNRSSQMGAMLKSICRNKEFVFALTATPIVTHINQMAKLFNIVDAKYYPDIMKTSHMIDSGEVFREDPYFYIRRELKDFGVQAKIKGAIIKVPAMPHQINLRDNEVSRICKGKGAVAQTEALVNFIKRREGDPGLVYVYEHATREWLIPFLQKAGIKYACVNGLTKPDEVAAVMRKFNVEKSLEVYWMVTTSSGEDEKFVRTIVNRSIDIQRILGTRYTAVFDAARGIDYAR